MNSIEGLLKIDFWFLLLEILVLGWNLISSNLIKYLGDFDVIRFWKIVLLVVIRFFWYFYKS